MKQKNKILKFKFGKTILPFLLKEKAVVLNLRFIEHFYVIKIYLCTMMNQLSSNTSKNCQFYAHTNFENVSVLLTQRS